MTAKLAHAWAVRTGGLLQQRPGFEGLAEVDRVTTFGNWGQWSLERKGILRAAMNGTFFTNDALVHTGHIDTKSCPFCGSLDSKYHRLWECPHFAQQRNKIPADVREQILQMPPCFHVHGWVTEAPEVGQFRKALHAIPDTITQFDFQSVPDGAMHLFTDGACLAPKHPGARVATWAVCIARVEDESFPILAQGGVSGGAQTALRGELTAAISAVVAALTMKRQFTLWLDNQAVYNFLDQCKRGCGRLKTVRQKNHLLWNRLLEVTSAAMDAHLFCGAVKVQSHAEILADTPPIDQWALKGNQAADQAASAAFLLLPPRVQQLWPRVYDALLRAERLRDWMHQLIVDTGERTFLDPVPPDVTPLCPVVAREPPDIGGEVSFLPLPVELIPYPVQLGDHVVTVINWLGSFINMPDAEPRWITAYHLMAHFQIATKKIGFQYLRSNKHWRPILDTKGFDGPSFLRCSRWFQTVLKNLSTHYDMPFIHEHCNPESDMIQCWCHCVRVPVPASWLRAIEAVFEVEFGATIRGIRAAFGKVDSFIDKDFT